MTPFTGQMLRREETSTDDQTDLANEGLGVAGSGVATKLFSRHTWSVPVGGWKRMQAFRIVSVKQARRETGLTLPELVALPGGELVTRLFADGREEQAIKLRIEPEGEAPHDR
jgi:hypothetical protein